MPFRSLLLLAAVCLFGDRALAQEREWSLDASDQDAYLIFGVPESDDVGISLWCPIRRGTVNVFMPETSEDLQPGRTVQMVIEAGEAKAAYRARTEANEDAGIPSAEAKVPADAPVFEAMKQADRFRIIIGRHETVFPLYNADLPGLLALCRKG
jgi:hypothetical protein